MNKIQEQKLKRLLKPIVESILNEANLPSNLVDLDSKFRNVVNNLSPRPKRYILSQINDDADFYKKQLLGASKTKNPIQILTTVYMNMFKNYTPSINWGTRE